MAARNEPFPLENEPIAILEYGRGGKLGYLMKV
ncbi:hypothetical protein JOC76_003873 [Neobacillus cucumis]|nr:hypothetical protein [Neobacillus cucumis]